MYKAGLLPAPVILPQTNNFFGSKLQIDKDTFIEIRCDAPNSKIFFTVDGTKPGPFQLGRTGRPSSNKYIGAFRLQPGRRVIKAIAVSRDQLRESTVATKYIEVFDYVQKTNEEYEVYPEIDDTNQIEYVDERTNHRSRSGSNRFRSKSPFNNGIPDGNPDLQGSIEGPINPTNYAGTQINIWGFPPADLGSLIDPTTTRSNYGLMTQEMINRINTPRPQEAIEYSENQNFNAFCKQLEKLYEKDKTLKPQLDTIVEKASLKSANFVEKNDSYVISFTWKKFKPTPVRNTSPPSPPRRSPTPPPVIKPAPKPFVKPVEKPVEKPIAKPVENNVPKPEAKPAPIKKEPEKEPVIYKEELQHKGTLPPSPNFNAEMDCEALKYAVKGSGTKDDIILSIMGNRNNEQRMKIKEMYKLMFGKELVDDLKGDTSGNYKKLLVGLLMTPVEFDCAEIRKAVKGLGTDDAALIEILTSRSNSRLNSMSEAYVKLYNKKLEADISGDTSGDYRKLLLSLVAANRPETKDVNMSIVSKDVDDLVDAGIKKLGTDEAKFNEIFAKRSDAHMRAIFTEYKKKTGKDIEDSIKSEMSFNLKKTYLSLISNIRNRPAYFATRVNQAIKGIGTDESTLNRIFISRCEVDMIQIKEEYQNLYKVSLEKDIKDDVSGDYGGLLLLLAKDPSVRVYEPVNIGKSNLVVATSEPHEIIQVEEPKIEETPSLRDASGFDPKDDCKRLMKAMKGIGTDEKEIIDVVCKRSVKQRVQLLPTYLQIYGKDLIKELKDEMAMKGDFGEMIFGLLMNPAEFDAWAFMKTIKGLGTDEKGLIELLTTRSTSQIAAAKEAFKKMYNKDIETEIKDDTSGDFQKVCVALLTANRPTGNMVDLTQADVDAQNLINAGIKKLGSDESRFIVILCSRSYAQLRAVFEAYTKRTGHSLSNDIESEFSGDIKKALLSIIDCIIDKQAHFAELLYKAIKGLGTNEACIIRVLVSRCEIDMVQIKKKFQDLYKESLVDWLKGDLSSHFLHASLTLIGEEDEFKKKKK